MTAMKTLRVADMHCEMCVKRITKALEGEGIEFSVDLGKKTVSVDAGKVAEAVEALDDLGFTAEE